MVTLYAYKEPPSSQTIDDGQGGTTSISIPGGTARVTTANPLSLPGFPARTVQEVKLTEHIPLRTIVNQLAALLPELSGTVGDEAIIKVTLGS